MNFFFRRIAAIVFLVSGAEQAAAATITYTALPYRSRSDSPFFQSIQNGTTYVEDFEDKAFNTPGIAYTNGRVFDSPERSVDEDDGLLNNTGLGWCLTADRNRPVEGSPYACEIRFEANGAGQYPSHAGAAILGFVTSTAEVLRYFQAFDANGAEILAGPLTAPVLLLPNVTPFRSTRGDTFFGLVHEAGISRIIMSGVNSDHIQYGYGPIPEPAAGTLLAGGLLLLSGRRRRSLL
jgi:hypothetical protein